MFDYSFVVDFLFMWIRVATPILLCSLGAVICQQAGVVNLGLDGIMLISAMAGVLGSAITGNLLGGIVAGVGSALIISAIFAYFHLVLKANPVLCGTAINTIAGGLTVFVLQLATGEKGTSSSLKSYSFPSIEIPIIKDIPMLGDIISGHNTLTYFGIIMVVLLSIFLYRMPMGLRIRAVGENPNAAASVGLNVIKIRFLAIMLCGILAGLGGMYLSMGYLSMFTRGMVAGRGFIALAAAAMGQATPLGTFISAMVFSFFDGLSNVLQMLSIPSEFIQMTPYFATIFGITLYSIQKINRNKKKNQEVLQNVIK